MSHRSPLAAAGLVLAVASVLLVAAPAAATFTPDGTATLTAQNTSYEGGSAGIQGACPEDTVSAQVVSDRPEASVFGLTYTGDVADDTQDGTVAAGWTVPVENAIPGVVVTFTLSCLDAASAVLATVTATATAYDSGASISAPASAPLESTVTVSGVCADHESVAFVDLEVAAMGAEFYSETQAISPAGGFSITFPVPSDLGGGVTLNPGNEIEATASCGSGDERYSVRVATITMSAAEDAEPADPGDDSSTLAETGATVSLPALVGAGLIVLAGAGLLLARRRGRSIA